MTRSPNAHTGWTWRALMGFVIPTLILVGLTVLVAFQPNGNNGMILLTGFLAVDGLIASILYVRWTPRSLRPQTPGSRFRPIIAYAVVALIGACLIAYTATGTNGDNGFILIAMVIFVGGASGTTLYARAYYQSKISKRG